MEYNSTKNGFTYTYPKQTYAKSKTISTCPNQPSWYVLIIVGVKDCRTHKGNVTCTEDIAYRGLGGCKCKHYNDPSY